MVVDGDSWAIYIYYYIYIYLLNVLCQHRGDKQLSAKVRFLRSVAVCHALGHVTSNVNFAAVAVSFTHTIKGDRKFDAL